MPALVAGIHVLIPHYSRRRGWQATWPFANASHEFETTDAAAKSRDPFRRPCCRARARLVLGQSRRAFSYRCQDVDFAALGVTAMDLLRAATSRAAIATSGAASTPSCSFSMSRPRWRPGIGPASNAVAKTPWPLPRAGKPRKTSARGRRQARWMQRCTANALTGGPSGCIGAISTHCPTAPSSRWRRALSRSAATRCCAGRRRATTIASRGHVPVMSMYSPRRQSLRFCRQAIGRAGIRQSRKRVGGPPRS